MKFAASLIAFLASTALAQYISDEPSGSNCDGTQYSQHNIDDAATAALFYYNSGDAPGGYPHKYNDYEGFEFLCESPYLEFPIERNRVYSGGSPGADRVVIGSLSADGGSAQYCAVLTHRGESGNDFQECQDD